MTELREPLQVLESKGAILYSPQWQGLIQASHFHAEFWQHKPGTEILAQGRSTTLKVQSGLSEKPWVLRQYYRGGALGRFVDRTYIYTSEKDVRSVAEWRLLNQLHECGMAVPKPVAAIYWRSGFTYQAAILTEFIQDSKTLSEYLLSNEKIDWGKVATVIKALHKLGCVHGDLNAHNILIHGDHAVTIIDFDKSKIVKSKPHRIQKKNLLRLKRSILKITNWPEEKLGEHWQTFMQAYTSA